VNKQHTYLPHVHVEAQAIHAILSATNGLTDLMRQGHDGGGGADDAGGGGGGFGDGFGGGSGGGRSVAFSDDGVSGIDRGSQSRVGVSAQPSGWTPPMGMNMSAGR